MAICFSGYILNESVIVLQFEDVAALTDHLESLLHFRCQLSERESKAQEQADEQRKALLTLEQQHNLLLLQRNNQLSQLQTELEKTRSEGLIWVWHIILDQNPSFSAKTALDLGVFWMNSGCPVFIQEKKWNNIQETATKKTLKLGQIKMSILNLYEMTGGQIGGEEGVDVNDTEKQLEQVCTFTEQRRWAADSETLKWRL